MTEQQKWKHAVREQGYTGTFDEWQAMDADQRNEYELGAAGIPTEATSIATAAQVLANTILTTGYATHVWKQHTWNHDYDLLIEFFASGRGYAVTPEYSTYASEYSKAGEFARNVLAEIEKIKSF